MCASVNPKAQVRNRLKKDDNVLQAQVSAGCKLLNIYNREMKCLQQINNIILLKGGMKKSGFTRMQSTNDCQRYSATIGLTDKLAGEWDDDLRQWQQINRTKTILKFS